ncbi:RNA polymerase sigma factor [Burkholderia stabilis]|uniref:RNA polymerase sigma factor n=1 Tax=Burkholderia stabilis TaxID=95485 RepID=UPI00080BB86A|nr:sigma factor [Burkholderia stabilis]
MLIRRRVGDAADAADLVHDTFLRLIVKPALKDFGSDAEARAYLRAIAQGMGIDVWRRREVEQAWLNALAVSSAHPASTWKPGGDGWRGVPSIVVRGSISSRSAVA